MNEHDTRIDRWSLAGVGLWAMIGSLAIVLAVRAMGGAFDEPAPLLVPVLATLVSTALSLSSWTLFYWTGRTSDSGRRLFDGLLSMVPAGIIAYTTSMNSQTHHIGDGHGTTRWRIGVYCRPGRHAAVHLPRGRIELLHRVSISCRSGRSSMISPSTAHKRLQQPQPHLCSK